LNKLAQLVALYWAFLITVQLSKWWGISGQDGRLWDSQTEPQCVEMT